MSVLRFSTIACACFCATLASADEDDPVYSDPVYSDPGYDNIATSNANLFDFEHVSCTGAPNEIRIVVTGVERSIGLINSEIYRDDQEKFLRYVGRLQTVRFAAKAPVTAFCMQAPAPGLFSVVVYHDENASGDFDRNAIGLPAEPWGLSNDPKMRLAPPKVKDTLFPVEETGANLEIRLR